MAGAGRSGADERLAAELAAGRTVKDAAAAAGVGERTVYRRLGDAAFRARVVELRAEMLSRAAGRLADGMAAGSDALNALVAHRDPNIRLKAARAVVELSLKVRAQTELADRLARVEALWGEGPMFTESRLARVERLAAGLPTPRVREQLALYQTDPTRLMADAGFTPDPWQAQLLRSDAGRVLMVCARQVGKSSAVAILALKTALTQPGSTVTIVAPVEDQANELLRKVVAAYRDIGSPVGVVHEAVTRLELANGSRVLSLPGKERRMRSFTSSLLVIDEAARVPDDVVNAASPTMAVSRGRFVALSTAFAKSGWFYNQWRDGQEPYLRLSVKARDCPRIPEEFLAAERRKLGQRWFQMEYENVFADDVAAVFGSDDIRAALTSDVEPLFGRPV